MIISKYTFKLLIIMLLFASAGCSNDEPSGEKTDEEAGNIDDGNIDDTPSGDDLKEELQGYWVAKKMTVTIMGETKTYDEDDLDDLKGEAGLEFYDQTLNFQGNYVNGTSYTIKDDMINVPAWYGDTWGKIKLSGSTLQITYEMEAEGISYTAVIEYVRGSRSARSTSDYDSTSGLLHAISKLI